MVNKSSFTNKLVVREQKKKTKTAAKIHSAEQGNAEINSNKLHLKIVLSPLAIPYTYFEARSRVVSKIRLLTNNEEMKVCTMTSRQKSQGSHIENLQKIELG